MVGKHFSYLLFIVKDSMSDLLWSFNKGHNPYSSLPQF